MSSTPLQGRRQVCKSRWAQWRLQGRANPGIARVFLHTIYHMICLKRTAHARMYTVSVDVTWHVAMDYGGVNLESVEARSVRSHLCLPGLLLVSAGASGWAEMLLSAICGYSPLKIQRTAILLDTMNLKN